MHVCLESGRVMRENTIMKQLGVEIFDVLYTGR